MILHGDQEDVADRLRQGGLERQQNTGQGGAEQKGFTSWFSMPEMGEFDCVIGGSFGFHLYPWFGL
jgi:hypothetical protein